MNASKQTIGRQTAISVGLAVLIVACTWAIASDRQQAKSQIDSNTETLHRHELMLTELHQQMRYLMEGMVRVESKLGTLPSPKKE